MIITVISHYCYINSPQDNEKMLICRSYIIFLVFIDQSECANLPRKLLDIVCKRADVENSNVDEGKRKLNNMVSGNVKFSWELLF